MYGYLCACGMNLNSAGVWICETFWRLYNARGEAKRIIQPLESFTNTHPLSNDIEGGKLGLQCFCEGPQMWTWSKVVKCIGILGNLGTFDHLPKLSLIHISEPTRPY